MQCVLQIVAWKCSIYSNDPRICVKVELSDGEKILVGVLDQPISATIELSTLLNSVIRLKEFVVRFVGQQMIILIVDMDIVARNINAVIGNPTRIRAKDICKA